MSLNHVTTQNYKKNIIIPQKRKLFYLTALILNKEYSVY